MKNNQFRHLPLLSCLSQRTCCGRLMCTSVLLFLSLFSIAQNSWNIPLALYNKSVLLDPTVQMGILVEGNPVEIANAAKKHGGFLRYNQGTICSVSIPAGELVSFSRENGIEKIGNAAMKLQPLNDTSKVQSRVNEVHAGMAPLSQAYHGENIIMGMIDSGIDFNHPDFKDANGNTRILNIWDQRDNTGPGPAPWNYGTIWDSAQINAGTCTHNDLQYYGHGTHTTGIAAGNGQSVAAVDYSGVATKSDIIMVGLDFNGVNSAVAVADAAAYIYARAQALGRPCVINASVGDYYGSHDGQDLQSLMIDSMLDVSGRSFVCAVGNAGNLKMHLSYTLSSDTNITWYSYSGGNIYIQLWADTNNFNNAKMAIGCLRDGSFSDVGRTSFSTIQNNLNTYSTDTIKNAAGQRMALVQKYGSIQGSAYSMEFNIVPDSGTGYDYSTVLTGSGLFHCWCFDLYGNSLPSNTTYPAIIYYKQPDTISTVCSGFQCSDRTICVGNYVNRSSWMDYNNVRFYDNSVIAGEIMWNSSVGPTRDGRVRPDITAPGANTISCGVISELPNLIAGTPQYVGVGGFHVADGGSSASSPMVAGCADLWLQQYPSANWHDVKNAVEFCAHTDGFTGIALPDNTWGFGKVDAFAMMTNCYLTTGTQIPEQHQLQLFPNPVNSGMDAQLNFGEINNSTTVEIFSVNGKLLLSKQIQQGENSVLIPGHLLSSGMYFVRLKDEQSSRTEKLVVE
jgi:hypothetical protein